MANKTVLKLQMKDKQMMELKNVTYWYDPARVVINNVSASLSGGRVYGLLGLNGSGKTTLLKLMSGLLFPKEGEILADGRSVGSRSAEVLSEIAFMPSKFSLRKESIDRYVALNSVFYPSFSLSVLDDCFKEFGIDPQTRNLSELSLGNSHKFMFSFLLSLGTRVLLLDEPLNGMDVPSRNQFRRLLIRHMRDDQTVVISTHVMADVENILSDVMILRKDGSLFGDSVESLSRKYSFGISGSPDGCLYAENCAEGYKVIRENSGEGEFDADGEGSGVPMEILFNAVTKGVIK